MLLLKRKGRRKITGVLEQGKELLVEAEVEGAAVKIGRGVISGVEEAWGGGGEGASEVHDEGITPALSLSTFMLLLLPSPLELLYASSCSFSLNSSSTYTGVKWTPGVLLPRFFL